MNAFLISKHCVVRVSSILVLPLFPASSGSDREKDQVSIFIWAARCPHGISMKQAPLFRVRLHLFLKKLFRTMSVTTHWFTGV